MTNPHILLADRIASAPPSRELECEIARLLGWTRSLIRDGVIGNEWVWTDPITKRKWPTHPARFLTDLNASVAAVPEGWRIYSIQDQTHFQSHRGWHAGIDRYRPPFLGGALDVSSVCAPTACQALMSAILRAMAGEGL